MKQFLKNYLGLIGLAIYYVIAVIIRIPVFFVLSFVVIFIILLWNPIMRRDDNVRWINNLYDWYKAD